MASALCFPAADHGSLLLWALEPLRASEIQEFLNSEMGFLMGSFHLCHSANSNQAMCAEAKEFLR